MYINYQGTILATKQNIMQLEIGSTKISTQLRNDLEKSNITFLVCV